MALADRSVMCERMVVPKGIEGLFLGVSVRSLFPPFDKVKVQSLSLWYYLGTKSLLKLTNS